MRTVLAVLSAVTIFSCGTSGGADGGGGGAGGGGIGGGSGGAGGGSAGGVGGGSGGGAAGGVGGGAADAGVPDGGYPRTWCEDRPCTGFRLPDGGPVTGLCGSQSIGPSCTCARDANGPYHPLCTGGCLPDGGALCLTVNCGTVNCLDAPQTGSLWGTACVSYGECR